LKIIDGKSVLLGMGLGIIITSILGVIFFFGYEPQLSDSEVIARAQALGMADRYENSADISRNADGSLAITIYEDETFSQVSKRLYEEGIIKSSIEFDILIKKGNLEKAIKPGRYTINADDDIKAVIQKITQEK